MRHFRLYTFLIVCVISQVFLGNTLAQNSGVRFEKITIDDGLSQNSVTCIYQSRDGFIWLGTYNGLNRYNGYENKVFQHNPEDPTSISNNYIWSIIEDNKGYLWIGTLGGGLNRYDPQTETFISFTHDPGDKYSIANNSVYSLYLDHSGFLWAGTWGGGLNKVVSVTEITSSDDQNSDPHMAYKFIQFNHDPNNINTINSNRISHIMQTRDNKFWVSSGIGLSCLDLESGKLLNFTHNPDNPQSISSNNVSSVCEDNAGNLWVGTWDEGLNLFQPASNSFIRFKKLNTGAGNKSQLLVKRIYKDHSGNIWIGTWGEGISKIIIPESLEGKKIDDTNYRQIKFAAYKPNALDQYSLSGAHIYNFYEDRTGILWIGTDWHGVNKYNKEQNRYAHYYSYPAQNNSLSDNVVFALHLDSKNNLWIGTLNGLNVLDRTTNKFTVFFNDPSDPNSLSHNDVFSIIEDRQGNIWVGTTNGLNKYNPYTHRFTRYYSPEYDSSYMNVIALYEDHSGIIWIGNNGGGLMALDPKTGRYKTYRSDPDNPNSLSSDIIRSICEDHQGILWIATATNGLCAFDKNTGNFRCYKNNPSDTSSISNNELFSLYVDKKDNLWIGTSTGLNRLVRNKKIQEGHTFLNYSVQDENLRGQIACIVEDSKGNLWLSSRNGLIRYNPEQNETRKFKVGYGLQSNEYFINAMFSDTIASEIFIGGVNGFSIFNPDEIKSNQIPPDIHITQLRVSNKLVDIGEEINGRVPLKKSIAYMDKLELTHKENVVGFEFVALHYISPYENQYAFKLEGFDKEWNYVGNQRTANYTNLKPGKYTFMVKGANSDGVWNQVPVKLEVVILAPWWQRKITRIFGILIILTVFFLLYQLRVSLLEKQKFILEGMVVERTDKLSEMNVLLEERQKEISKQNEELMIHRTNLERLVEERTTELKAAKNKAEESDKLKSAFLANMSHEIRTPMNAIMGFATLLGATDTDVEKREKYIKTINTSGETLLTLINDILDISMIEANQLTLNMSNFSIDEILEDLETYFELRKNNKVDLKLISPKTNKEISIYSDAVRFRQIMTNLVNNALKYTTEGYVQFGYKVQESHLKFFVADTGTGIPEDEQKHVFDYFYKVEYNPEKIHSGAGIGLSISQRLVELLGGEIWFESEMNIGTTFFFTLPKGTVNKTSAEKI